MNVPALVSIRPPGEARDAEGGLLVPVYVELGDNRVLASFGRQNGQSESLEVRRERARSYPGLSSLAPRTESIYRAFSSYAEGKVVLDIGCGSGAGLARLRNASGRIGVDRSELAVRFGKRAVPGAEFHCLDATEDALPQASVALVVDVLGSVPSPLSLLRRAANALGDGGLLCIAEPSANIAQELIMPVRRALSRPELSVLLAEAGFVVEEWLSEGRFWVSTARRRSNEWVSGLEAADQLLEAGLASEARGLLEGPPRSGGGAIEAGWFLRLFQAHQQLGQGDRALEALMEGHRRAPEDARVLTALADASLGLGSREDAERFSRAAVERDAASPLAHRALARALKESSGPTERIARLSAALKLDPSNVELAVSLAIAASDAQICFVGTRALERVREYHVAMSADFHLTLGWLYLISGRVDEALLECKLANIAESGHPGIQDLMLSICETQPNPLGLA
jgi:SAM-dependent methyltransferase